MYNATSKVTDVSVAYVHQDIEGAFKQVDVVSEGAGVPNQWASKFVDFTAQGNHLVYKNAAGWNVFLLAAYNQYYVAAKNQTYAALPEFDEAEDANEDGKYNAGLQAFKKFSPSKSPASTQVCQSFYGQANTVENSFQKQECSPCSSIYNYARSVESDL